MKQLGSNGGQNDGKKRTFVMAKDILGIPFVVEGVKTGKNPNYGESYYVDLDGERVLGILFASNMGEQIRKEEPRVGARYVIEARTTSEGRTCFVLMEVE